MAMRCLANPASMPVLALVLTLALVLVLGIAVPHGVDGALWCTNDYTRCLCGVDSECDDASIQSILNWQSSNVTIYVWPYAPTNRSWWMDRYGDRGSPPPDAVQAIPACASIGGLGPVVQHNWSSVALRGEAVQLASACEDVAASAQAAYERSQSAFLRQYANTTITGHPSSWSNILCNVVQVRATNGSVANMVLDNRLCNREHGRGDAALNITTARHAYLDAANAGHAWNVSVLSVAVLSDAPAPVVLAGSTVGCAADATSVEARLHDVTVQANTSTAAYGVFVYSVGAATVRFTGSSAFTGLPSWFRVVGRARTPSLVVTGLAAAVESNISAYEQLVQDTWPPNLSGEWWTLFAYDVAVSAACTTVACPLEGRVVGATTGTGMLVAVVVLAIVVVGLMVFVAFYVHHTMKREHAVIDRHIPKTMMPLSPPKPRREREETRSSMGLPGLGASKQPRPDPPPNGDNGPRQPVPVGTAMMRPVPSMQQRAGALGTTTPAGGSRGFSLDDLVLSTF